MVASKNTPRFVLEGVSGGARSGAAGAALTLGALKSSLVGKPAISKSPLCFPLLRR